jgi:hypothetical protein
MYRRNTQARYFLLLSLFLIHSIFSLGLDQNIVHSTIFTKGKGKPNADTVGKLFLAGEKLGLGYLCGFRNKQFARIDPSTFSEETRV